MPRGPLPHRPRSGDDGLAAAVERVGDRWSLLLAAVLLGGPLRFNDLLERLPGLSPNILSARLKHLEGVGLLVARPYSERPPRFEYQLTARGAALGDALAALARWGAELDGAEQGGAEELEFL
ncbi:MAG: winged helix-turn-helix transcriptional regulator [Acidimicrobiales bacterium]